MNRVRVGTGMDSQSKMNKAAWEYRAYEFWNMRYGTPGEKAVEILRDPKARLRYHRKYFEHIEGLKIANPLGSNGRIAVPLALLGADVTVFDLWEENRRYALELARCAGVELGYAVGDFLDIPLEQYAGSFDISYSEGGILHYFSDISRLTQTLFAILKPGGKLILSDFHPLRKIIPLGETGKNARAADGDYFESELHDGSVAYQNFFPSDEQGAFPQCRLRFYTLSEIINAVIGAGFTLKEFTEHPHWENKKLPGEFTIYAVK